MSGPVKSFPLFALPCLHKLCKLLHELFDFVIMRRERFSISVFGVAPYNFTRGHSGKSSAADDRFFGVWPILACLLDHLCSQLVVAYPTPPLPLFFSAVRAILCFCTLFCFVMASLSVKYAKSTSWKMPSSHPSYFLCSQDMFHAYLIHTGLH